MALLGAGTAQAASLERVGGFEAPIYVTSDPGKADRLFVVERQGIIAEAGNGAVTDLADLRSVVSCCEGERGLLSVALAPDFDSSGRLFVDYTGEEVPGEIHVAELRVSGNVAPISTLRNMLTIPHPGFANHNGGQLQFGPEGMLFISTGDGGNRDDSQHNAQNKESLLGKILRIGPDPGGALPFTVPADNPFPGSPVWSYGLRNPFRFSFDRASGAMVIGDVGQDLREEVDYAPLPGLGRGANYGWNCREGTIAGKGDDEGCATSTPSDFVEPVFDYPHVEAGSAPCGGAIIGGYVVRDQSLGSLFGRYLYGDACTSEIRSLDLSNPLGSDRSEGLQLSGLDSFGEDSCGRLYVVSTAGAVDRLVGSAAAVCPETKVHAPAFIGIRAQRRKVKRHRRAFITVGVSPCNGRKGEPVKLMQGRRSLGTRHLDRACTARFRPRIPHPLSLRATIAADASYTEAISRKLRIRILRHSHRKHR